MNDIQNWTEITQGIYRYVLAIHCAYEIHIIYWEHGTDILTAKASLFIVGDWHSKNGTNSFERECLMSEQPLFQCIEEAVEDNKKNNNY